LNKYEKKAFFINFAIFFFIQLILIILINLQERKIQIHNLNSSIKRELEICSYKLNCKNINISFEKKESSKNILTLMKNDKEIYILVETPFLKKNYLKIGMPLEIYHKKINLINQKIFKSFLFQIVFIFFTSLLLAFYALSPLRKALKINETFIKDILHDFNTPLSSIKINLYRLKKNKCDEKTVSKIESSVNSILKLQENLKSFLNSIPNQKETFELKKIIDDEIKTLSPLYPHISVKTNIDNIKLSTNKNAFKSIIHNILSNAFKYNKKNGSIYIYNKKNNLIIEDTGTGIKNPSKIFERFYKEHERGIGIGMNIVKKLCEELKIEISIDSKLDKGTKVSLNLKNIEVHK